ncbi:helix-turn-helix domain-containing protein [Flagellimonas pacifica]|uniref:Helix-turn-helix domain-containing protein n=1 Tax=Flagellimonas pacifica TaxID=1247520 RepID=A0A285MQS5_9FLAO|nr:helix-turn-helix domain-containing protein [Allomuricauda parva]SNY99529.1 Helix-turn-helix domain-containing protein [Allomuricauda parva]
MGASVVTTEDLMDFRKKLLEEFKDLMMEHTHPVPKTWLRSADVMDRLGISHGTLQKLRSKKVIPSYKIEGILFYDAIEIDAILMSNKVQMEEVA